MLFTGSCFIGSFIFIDNSPFLLDLVVLCGRSCVFSFKILRISIKISSTLRVEEFTFSELEELVVCTVGCIKIAPSVSDIHGKVVSSTSISLALDGSGLVFEVEVLSWSSISSFND
jgi:hypothetical protein